MAELYFLPYKAIKIYGTGTEISFFGRSKPPFFYGTGTEISFFDRSKLSISTDQYAILLISAVEACGDGRAGFRPERFSYVPANK